MKNFVCKITLLLLFCKISMPTVQAQSTERAKQEAYSLQSPFHAIYNHRLNLQPDQYNPSQAAASLRWVQIQGEDQTSLAIKLHQIINANGLIFIEEEIPLQSDYIDSASGQYVYTPFEKFPEIYLERTNGYNGRQIWQYSEATVRAIPALYRKTFPFRTDKLFDFVGNGNVLGFTWVNLIGLAVLLVVPFFLYRVVLSILIYGGKKMMGTFTQQEARSRRIKKISRPISLFLVFLLAKRLVPIFQFPSAIAYYLILVIDIALPVFVLLMSIGFVNLLTLYMEKMVDKQTNIWFAQLIPFIRTSLQIVAIVVSLIYLLETLELNVTALIAGLSIGGLAFALAAQDTLKNFFGSITIFIDHPFRVGDWIVADGIDGVVEQVGVRSTRIRSLYNSVLHVPNGRMADLTIDNLGMRIYRRYRTTISITYDTPPALIKAFLKGLREIVRKHPQTRKDFFGIHFYEFGSASLNILFNVFLNAPDFENEWYIREQINLEILELAHSLGVRFAFPTQTLHIEGMPGHPSLTPQYSEADLNEETLKVRLENFMKREKIHPSPPKNGSGEILSEEGD